MAQDERVLTRLTPSAAQRPLAIRPRTLVSGHVVLPRILERGVAWPGVQPDESYVERSAADDGITIARLFPKPGFVRRGRSGVASAQPGLAQSRPLFFRRRGR